MAHDFVNYIVFWNGVAIYLDFVLCVTDDRVLNIFPAFSIYMALTVNLNLAIHLNLAVSRARIIGVRYVAVYSAC